MCDSSASPTQEKLVRAEEEDEGEDDDDDEGHGPAHTDLAIVHSPRDRQPGSMSDTKAETKTENSVDDAVKVSA